MGTCVNVKTGDAVSVDWENMTELANDIAYDDGYFLVFERQGDTMQVFADKSGDKSQLSFSSNDTDDEKAMEAISQQIVDDYISKKQYAIQ